MHQEKVEMLVTRVADALKVELGENSSVVVMATVKHNDGFSHGVRSVGSTEGVCYTIMANLKLLFPLLFR